MRVVEGDEDTRQGVDNDEGDLHKGALVLGVVRGAGVISDEGFGCIEDCCVEVFL